MTDSPPAKQGLLHASARALGIAANVSTLTSLFLAFGTANQLVAESTRLAIQGAFVAGLAFSAAGLVLLFFRVKRKPGPGWGLLLLVVLPFLVCVLLMALAFGSRLV